MRLVIGVGLLLLAAAEIVSAQTWREVRKRYQADCGYSSSEVVAELRASRAEADLVPFPSLVSPEASVYGLGLAVIRESLDLYDAVRHERFTFFGPHRDQLLDFAEDRERMRRIFTRSDFTRISLAIGAAVPSEVPGYPASEGYVQIRACWHRVGVKGFVGINNEQSLFVLLPEELPDAAPLWRIVLWESPWPHPNGSSGGRSSYRASAID